MRWDGICDFRSPIVTSKKFSLNAACQPTTPPSGESVQRYAPELNKRCRQELKPTNGSWRVDETYIRVKGKWTYLYRAVDSTGATIDFLLAARRDAAAAKRFFQKLIS